MIDSIPLWFVIPAAILASFAFFALELRASKRFYEAQDASDPVVVTGSGNRRDRYPRSCGGVR